MARARKPTGEDRNLAIDTSGFGFEDEGEWKVAWYEGNNLHRQRSVLPSELEAISEPSLFTPDVRTELEKDFNLTEAEVAELARRVEAALDPALSPLTLAVAQSDGTRRGTAAVERAYVALSDARDRITDAFEALVPLRAIDEDGDARRTLRAVVDAIDQCQSSAHDAWTILGEQLRYKGVLYESAVADKRQVVAARRTMVLFAIFDFWVWAGRRVTISRVGTRKNNDDSRRFGHLVDLCFYVIRLTRKDGRWVSDTTIINAIEDWKGR